MNIKFKTNLCKRLTIPTWCRIFYRSSVKTGNEYRHVKNFTIPLTALPRLKWIVLDSLFLVVF